MSEELELDQEVKEGTIASLRPPHQFQPGNTLWQKSIENRKRLGKFPDASALLEMVCEYFQWLEDNPLNESKLVTYEGSSTLEEIPKMRAPSMPGLCAFLGIHRDTWGSWRRGDDRVELKDVVEWAEQVMYDRKFSGAASNLLNPMLVARELGLSEKQEVTSPDGSMTPVVQYQLPSNGRD